MRLTGSAALLCRVFIITPFKTQFDQENEHNGNKMRRKLKRKGRPVCYPVVAKYWSAGRFHRRHRTDGIVPHGCPVPDRGVGDVPALYPA